MIEACCVENTRLSIATQIERLLSQEVEDYTGYLTEEIQALSLAVISHRRMIRTTNFNQLIKAFDSRVLESSNKYQVEKLYLCYSEELEERRFNFQDSSVSIEFSDSAIKRLLELSRGERLSHPRVHSEIEKLARSIEIRARQECSNTSISKEDVEQDLMMYLIENAESNFDPSKASYITYAITTLRFRAKILLASVRLRNTREVLTCFENNEETNSYHEKLQMDSSSVGGSSKTSASAFTASSSGLASHQYEVSTALTDFFENYTSLEKTLLYLKNQLSCNINTFGFDVSKIIGNAVTRAKVDMLL